MDTTEATPGVEVALQERVKILEQGVSNAFDEIARLTNELNHTVRRVVRCEHHCVPPTLESEGTLTPSESPAITGWPRT